MSESELNIVRWKLHDTNPELVDIAREKLSEVIDPEIGMSIIQLGMVREVEIENEITRLKMILTTPFCPYGPAMLETTRQKAETFLERPTTIEMGMDMWTPEMMEEGAGAEWGLF